MNVSRLITAILFLMWVHVIPAHSEQITIYNVYKNKKTTAGTAIGLEIPPSEHYTVYFRAAPPIPQRGMDSGIQSISVSAFQDTDKPGGLNSGLKSLFFGPRVGLESNENQPVTFIEKANLFVPLAPFQAYSENGIKGFAASAFLGPRIGMEIKQRKVRKKELLGLIPVIGVTYHLATSNPSGTTVLIEAVAAALLSRLWPAFEAFRGRTMTEIERTENLKK